MSTEWIDWEPPVCPGCANMMSSWSRGAVNGHQSILFDCGAALSCLKDGPWTQAASCPLAHSEEAMDAGQAKDQAAIADYYKRQQDAKNQGGS